MSEKSWRTKERIPVEKVLMSDKALALEDVLILGINDDGSPYYASSRGDDPWLIAMCEVFKHKLLSGQLE